MNEIAIKIEGLDSALEALAFYANPETYHALLILGDAPCGAFADDFDGDHGFDGYDRPMPGAKARAALRTMGIKVGGY